MLRDKIEVIVSKARGYVLPSRPDYATEMQVFETIRGMRRECPDITRGFIKDRRAYVALNTGEEIPGSEYLSRLGIELKLH